MRPLLLPVAAVFLSACASTPIPPVDPQQAWVDFTTPTPGSKLVMAQRLDGKNHDHFQAGQRYVLEGRSLAFTPNIRLYDSTRQLLAEERSVNCI